MNRHAAVQKFYGEGSRPDFTGSELSSLAYHGPWPFGFAPVIGLSRPILTKGGLKDAFCQCLVCSFLWV